MAKVKAQAGLKELPAAIAPVQAPAPELAPAVSSVTDSAGVTYAPPSAPRRFRVSLSGVKVRAVCPVRDVGIMQDHLDVVALDEAAALEAFAVHNGIPWTTDALTGARKLASVHAPAVVALE